MTLSSSVATIPLVGVSYAKKLLKLDIQTVEDLLYHLPSRYIDFSQTSLIKDIKPNVTATVYGQVTSITNVHTKSALTIQKAVIHDNTGDVEVVWFNQPFLLQSMHVGDEIGIAGIPKVNHQKLQFEFAEYEILKGKDSIHTGRIIPVYPETAGISSKWLRSRIAFVLKQISEKTLTILDPLGKETLEKENLLPLEQSLVQVHFPNNLSSAQQAHNRLAFNEILFHQLAGLIRKSNWQKITVGHKMEIKKFDQEINLFLQTLPFQLTDAQNKVCQDILSDLSKSTPMNRLLQGDVGSGKTIVAAIAMYVAKLNGLQSVLMAPTEILAMQHYRTLNAAFNPIGIKAGIATSSTKDYKNYDLVIGTHALLHKQISFNNLGLVIIDEQHKFGVEQRAEILKKGHNPHLLTMTATPIPRSIALTIYRDLDLSIIDQMPNNRQIIKTWVVPNHKRHDAYDWIKKQTSQVYIVCPLVDLSENLQTVKAAKSEYENLVKVFYPQMSVGLIHGKMPSSEKNATLEKFSQGKIDILVATPVVEVGIDVRNANIIIIEAAERFGLAQLHQLRGRVGRGEHQGYCLLFTENENEFAINRLKNLETINNGLKLAEIDLQLRGPGQRFGEQQHGKWDLKIADFSNLSLLEKAGKLAEQAFNQPQNFPNLYNSLEKSKISSSLN